MAQTLYTDIAELVTNSGVHKKSGVNVKEDDLGIIRNAALLWDSSKGVLWFGNSKQIPSFAKKKTKRISLEGKFMSPVLVDCHTHLVFGGSRHEEFAMRVSGKTYQEIATAGGGIQSSVSSTRKASEKTLFASACLHIEHLIKLGVGILEIKSGYGLDWKTERKMLLVIRKLKEKYRRKLLIQSTFLGAHAFPREAKTENDKNAFVDRIVNEMLPKVAKANLAEACDVFFDEGYFNLAQSERILTQAKKLGLKVKLHADELADTGGAALAAQLKALSADHLLKANEAGLRAMAKSGVVGVILPTTAFYLGLPYSDIHKLRRAEVCLALASDFNPGSSPTYHMPFVMSLAVLVQGFTLPEAFSAATYGGAKALGLSENHGHIEIGKKPRLAVFNCQSYKSLIQQVAHPGLCDFIIN